MPTGVLVTHQDCLDGATAALIGRAVGLEVRFVEPDRVAPAVAAAPAGVPLFLADVSLSPADWAAWQQRVSWLLDHHQTALTLAGRPRVTIDLARSGARLMYDFACAQGWLRPSPAWERLVNAVQRYDLWQPRHEAGQNLNRMFRRHGLDWYLERFQSGWTPWTADEGDELAAIVRGEGAFIVQALGRRRHRRAAGYGLVGLYLPEEGPINEVAHRLLAQGEDLVIFIKSDGRLSARSSTRLDAARLMETLFSGGGHARAAGGRLTSDLTPGDAATDAVLDAVAAYLVKVGAGPTA
ncbi:MAG: phosphoesterase [Firmicutes bacterium]|nr:phosphoesterase [Alicyclobacillaceae bacterium]MCL6498207.1 phosphoesterase [Bacillota bacterium]